MTKLKVCTSFLKNSSLQEEFPPLVPYAQSIDHFHSCLFLRSKACFQNRRHQEWTGKLNSNHLDFSLRQISKLRGLFDLSLFDNGLEF